MLAPLTERGPIEARHEAVAALAEHALARAALLSALDGVRDVERLATKAALGRSTPRELGALGASLRRLPDVHEALVRVGPAGVIGHVLAGWDGCEALAAGIGATLVERPPIVIGEDATIAAGRGCRTGRTPRAARWRKGRDCAHPVGGAGAHRHRFAQGGL